MSGEPIEVWYYGNVSMIGGNAIPTLSDIAGAGTAGTSIMRSTKSNFGSATPQCRHGTATSAQASWNHGFMRDKGNIFRDSTGFTLLEMIISIGIFSTIVVAAIGITIGISNAQIKASNVQAAQDNIRFSVELMTKEMRTGSQYELSRLCAATAGEEIRFVASSGTSRVYYRSGGSLMRLVDSTNCADAKPLLSEEVAVESIWFRVGGVILGATDGQPWAMVSLSIRSRGAKQVLDSQMDLQTMVVQRFRDQ